MHELNEQQINYILNDIKARSVETEDLQLNLLDHICCIIEAEMPEGNTPEEFYTSIIPRFFKRELKEIETETQLLLTFKHYYAMKKTMINSGAAAVSLFILGSIFKIMHWPGASALLVMGITIISLIFLPLLFILKSKELEGFKEKFILGTGVLLGILFSLSTLFKIQHWPGANRMWIIALGILFLVYIPVYFFTGIRNQETKANTVISSILLITAGGLLFTLTNIRTSRWMQYVSLRAELETEQSYQFIKSLTTDGSMINDTLQKENKFYEITSLCSKIIENIDLIKVNLGSMEEGKFKNDLKSQLEFYSGNYDYPTHYFFTEKGVNPELSALKSDLSKLKKMLSISFPEKNFDVFNTEDRKQFGEPEDDLLSWEKAYFDHVPFETVMRNLTQMQLNLKTTQNFCSGK